MNELDKISTDDESSKSKAKWKCRRGMLELDLMLQRFLDQGYDALTRDQKLLFLQLLDLDDPTLYAYLVEGVSPDNQAFEEIIACIVAEK